MLKPSPTGFPGRGTSRRALSKSSGSDAGDHRHAVISLRHTAGTDTEVVDVLRRWLRTGPKYGPSHLAAVSWRGDLPYLPLWLEPSQLPQWLADRGEVMTLSKEGLTVVDDAISSWQEDPEIDPALTPELGIYLGVVLVAQKAGARWHVWPNGHPVVRFAAHDDIDVLVLATQRVFHGTPKLPDVLTDLPYPDRTPGSDPTGRSDMRDPGTADYTRRPPHNWSLIPASLLEPLLPITDAGLKLWRRLREHF